MVGTHRASDGRHSRLSDLRGASPADASGRADHDVRRILRGAPERSLRSRQGPLPLLLLSAKFPRPASGGRQARSYGVVNLVCPLMGGINGQSADFTSSQFLTVDRPCLAGTMRLRLYLDSAIVGWQHGLLS